MCNIAGDATRRAREETDTKELTRQEIQGNLEEIEQSKTAEGKTYNFYYVTG